MNSTLTLINRELENVNVTESEENKRKDVQVQLLKKIRYLYSLYERNASLRNWEEEKEDSRMQKIFNTLIVNREAIYNKFPEDVVNSLLFKYHNPYKSYYNDYIVKPTTLKKIKKDVLSELVETTRYLHFMYERNASVRNWYKEKRWEISKPAVVNGKLLGTYLIFSMYDVYEYTVPHIKRYLSQGRSGYEMLKDGRAFRFGKENTLDRYERIQAGEKHHYADKNETFIEEDPAYKRKNKYGEHIDYLKDDDYDGIFVNIPPNKRFYPKHIDYYGARLKPYYSEDDYDMGDYDRYDEDEYRFVQDYEQEDRYY